jgi:type I restriction enzyme S subunit
VKRVGDMIEEIAMGPFGSNIKVDCFVTTGVPVLNGSNLTGFTLTEDNFNYVTPEKASSLKRAVASRGDVVITHRGTLGQISYIPINSKHEKYVISQSQFRVKCKKEELLPEFMVYFFHSRKGQHQLLSNSSQVGVPALARPSTTFQKLDMPVPSIKEQQTIVDTLVSLDDRIAENKKINHHLEQMAQAIFKSWFVDFEPFGGVMPSDWHEGTLSEIANITMGQSPSGTSYNEDSVGAVFYQGRAEFGSRFPTRRLFTTEPKRMAVKGDVLMSVRAPVGDLNVAFESCCLGRGLAGIQSNNDCQSFILYTMFALKQHLDMFNGEGTVFGSINKNDMANLPVVIPTDEVIRHFEEVASPMDATIETNYAEICNLQAARDSLLPRLMSGELSVADLGGAK